MKTHVRRAAFAFALVVSLASVECMGVPRECEIEYSELNSFSQAELTSIVGARQAGRGLGSAVAGLAGREVREDKTAEDAEFCVEVRKLLRKQDRLEREQDREKDREIQRRQLEELQEMNRRRRGY